MVLSAAIALDGDNGLFPIHMGEMEYENKDSWGFFLDHLHTIIGGGSNAKPWTFMSDEQKVLLPFLFFFLLFYINRVVSFSITAEVLFVQYF